MDIKTNSIQSKVKAALQSARHCVKSDIVLPDYYADIKKILKCGVEPSEEAVTQSEGKISIAGTALFSVVYTGDDKKIYVYETTEKYTKIISCASVESSDDIEVVERSVSVNYRALGPKRIEISADIQIEASVLKLRTDEIICDVDDSSIETHKRCGKIFIPSCIAQRDATIESSMELLGFSVNNDTVIRKRAKISVSEIRAIANKLYIKGNCDICFIYQKSDSGKICTHNYSDVFSEIIDVYGIEDGDVCFVTPKVCGVHISVKNGGGDKAVIDAEVKVRFSVFAGRQTDIEYIDDAYSVFGEIDTEYKELNMIKSLNENSHTINVSFDMENFDRTNGSICDCFVEDIRVAEEKNENGEINLLINALYSALIESEDSGFILLSRNYMAEHKIEVHDEANCDRVFSCQNINIDALYLPDGKIRITADFLLKIYTEEFYKDNMLVAISEDGSKSEPEGENIVLYFAQSGEKLWNIAKENKITLEAIRATNDTTGDSVAEAQLLILPNF